MAVPLEDRSCPSPEVERLYDEWLQGGEQLGDPAFTRLCAAHPEHIEELRGLDARRRARRPRDVPAELEPPPDARASECLPHPAAEVLAHLAARRDAHARYRVEGEIARGGMGAILRVWEQDLCRHLAMKVVLPEGASTEPGSAADLPPTTLSRFLAEAQVTGQLDHPGVVPVHELGLDAEGRLYFTMKLVRGVTLETVFDELARGAGGWTQTRVLGLLLRVCEAMAYAHDKGVVHRDLKPANVMVGRFGEVYVMDWGLAKVLDPAARAGAARAPAAVAITSGIVSTRAASPGDKAHSPVQTLAGDVVGTPAYMSPEQARGRSSSVGPPADVYSVGAMLYHLLAGERPPGPFEASSDRERGCAEERTPIALERAAPEAPAELAAICARAMAFDPAKRYADMSALAKDLSAYLEGRVVAAYETGAWAEARKWVRRNRALAAALLAAGVLALGGLAATSYVQSAERKVSDRERQRAEESERVARAQTAKVLRLSDVKILEELEQEAEGLWPAFPDRIGSLQAWLERARSLVGNLEEHRATLAEMRARAHAWSDAERARDRETHPRRAELFAKRAELAGLVDALDPVRAAEDSAARRLAALRLEVEALASAVEARRTWSLGSAEDQWQHDVLAELVAGLERLESGLLALEASSTAGGWSVPTRLLRAQELATGFAPEGAHAAAWEQALPAIRAAHPGLELVPQMGLLPIGRDPDAGLFEFAHLLTGRPAERGADGRLVLTEETGVVLVLLPGGTFRMGAQAADPAGANHDRAARGDEGPVHEVELSPFFLSKYEMTQAQWLRVARVNPSGYQQCELTPTLLSPVEQVSWLDCRLQLPRVGLDLPSEAQWEYGARAGTGSAWWTGAERESLRARHAANLADQAAARAGAPWSDIKEWRELDDGYAVHAPAGSTAANPFGLHEVAGNLWEWCLDGYEREFYARSPRRDPVAPFAGAAAHVLRGGSFYHAAASARSASRASNAPTFADFILGVRPAVNLRSP